MSEPKKKQFKIYLPRKVHGDFPVDHNVLAEAGVHDAIAHQYVPVSVVLPNGELPGV